VITAADVARQSRIEQGLDETVDPAIVERVAQVVARASTPPPPATGRVPRKAAA